MKSTKYIKNDGFIEIDINVNIIDSTIDNRIQTLIIKHRTTIKEQIEQFIKSSLFILPNYNFENEIFEVKIGYKKLHLSPSTKDISNGFYKAFTDRFLELHN